VDVGLEADGVEEGVDGAGEGGAAHPAAEDGGGRPELGGRAVLIGAEGAEKSALLVAGSGYARHKFLPFLGLEFLMMLARLKKGVLLVSRMCPFGSVRGPCCVRAGPIWFLAGPSECARVRGAVWARR
jgi:hypothetical protein